MMVEEIIPPSLWRRRAFLYPKNHSEEFIDPKSQGSFVHRNEPLMVSSGRSVARNVSDLEVAEKIQFVVVKQPDPLQKKSIEVAIAPF
ncbi:hypothetical protein Desor_2892 [Desulfosporosinus orientis DSM 765]|uniref:Uncharacterized protein n=1 Tax=Desulfosporosinus orientis (strain ATCC 19365 / DSM 765 / NCIMB 8382 / VKM B-1628 / Singapore I) TaxID=768706 RepID=G7WFH8_DESOD|nr:hypothetical protein [Desulfosporosinus orientis]AET68421.1 hypothetical protein Desor_2892 [Desulfosporosinus orientis DSM 765]